MKSKHGTWVGYGTKDPNEHRTLRAPDGSVLARIHKVFGHGTWIDASFRKYESEGAAMREVEARLDAE
jgi:hypothetical protein